MYNIFIPWEYVKQSRRKIKPYSRITFPAICNMETVLDL